MSKISFDSGIRLFDNIDKIKYFIEIEEVIPSELTPHLKCKLTKK